ncbi:sodium:proton antiporter NhaD [Plebeiibacterium sediminum]|uniref:Sodium:proton antiporter NhaD n=1 Tax=Plebeiibacterium sediminum TaxID=2992112 RepID=A0AAE3SEL8_9BACT|nr:sodium:proton antiporter NhaD [Plebeiobacterium sediminum]MCW3786510.1 sodium:proton antiporter NhaD [Plebeiobacterium sediminum]
MFYLMLILFVVGYGFIMFEHVNHINKAATALLMSSLIWAIFALGGSDILNLGFSSAWTKYLEELGSLAEAKEFITHHALLDNLAETSSILFFLLGAMTIVDLVDRYQGFRIITNKINSSSATRLLWIISLLTFFMSAILDNLTTTIVIITVLRKLLTDQKNRWIFASVVVVSANAGGAWSPIGDVTTIMLWIGSQLTAGHIIASVILPSLVNVIVATYLFSLLTKGQVLRPVLPDEETVDFTTPSERMFMLIIGILALVSVPVFKTVTHLPPYLGMLLGLGVLWVMNDRYLRHRPHEDKRHLNVSSVIKSVDIPTVMFFLGILSAVGALQAAGHLDLMASFLDEHVKNIYVINIIIGIVSSIVDNVPLVAASMGMYHIAGTGAAGYMANFVQDGNFWSFLAYCAGTGGSILIIGSAAGVAAMGLEKIDFMWYLKKVSLIALAGYLAGAAIFYLQTIII